MVRHSRQSGREVHGANLLGTCRVRTLRKAQPGHVGPGVPGGGLSGLFPVGGVAAGRGSSGTSSHVAETEA